MNKDRYSQVVFSSLFPLAGGTLEEKEIYGNENIGHENGILDVYS